MSKEVKKELNGKDFVAKLEGCKTPKAIFGLLSETMDKEVLKNRLQNVRDNDLVVALNAQVARFNASQGLRTSHQDCVNMAADKYQQISKKGVKFFKAEMNKYITGQEKEENAKQLANAVIMAGQKYARD